LISLKDKSIGQDNFIASNSTKDAKSTKKAKTTKKNSSSSNSNYSSSYSSADRSNNGGNDAANTSNWNQVGSVFPLKKGSKGNEVKAMQKAIIQQYGKSYLPRYGADGDFGNETLNALKRLHLPSTIDESAYHVLLQAAGKDTSSATSSSASSSSSSGGLGKQLFVATQSRNFSKVLPLLQQLKSKEDYQTANAEFQQYRLNGMVRKTLVNGLLSTFTTESIKQQIRFEFIRMGLKYDGNKWSLDVFFVFFFCKYCQPK
jgi:hypothetical protein